MHVHSSSDRKWQIWDPAALFGDSARCAAQLGGGRTSQRSGQVTLRFPNLLPL